MKKRLVLALGLVLGARAKMLRISTFLVSTALAGSLIVAMGTNVGAQQRAPGLSALQPVGPMLLNFNEFGSPSTIALNGGTPTPLIGTLLLDPSIPVGAPPFSGLTFMLPEPVVTGSVSFSEPGSGITDWLRFTDASGDISGAATGPGARMIFYSDISESSDPLGRPLADTGFPINIGMGNVLALTGSLGEVGAEGANGFDYRPGGIPYPLNNEYIGISDVPGSAAVPEPATLLLMASGLLGLVGWRRYSARA